MVELHAGIIDVGQLLPNCLKGERREPRVCLLTMDIIIFRQARFISSWNEFVLVSKFNRLDCCRCYLLSF